MLIAVTEKRTRQRDRHARGDAGGAPVKLIFDKSVAGRRGVRLPRSDVAEAPPLDAKFCRASPAELPEVSELDAVRHFTRLSQLNFSVDTQFYPLGSCTMKYNGKSLVDVRSLRNT